MPDRERTFLAMPAAAAASVFLGASVVATRFAVDQIGPASIGFLRYLIGAVCILAILRLTGQRTVARGDRMAVAALGIVMFGVFPWTFGASLQYIPAAQGAVVLATMPILTLVLARIRGFESLSVRKSAGVIAAFAGVGVALLAGRDTGSLTGPAWIGVGLMLATALLGAVYSVFSRPYLQRNPALGVTATSMAAGTLFLMPVAAVENGGLGPPDLSPGGVGAVLFLGTFGGAVAFWLWIWALEHAAPTRVAVFLTLNPMTATLLAALFLGERITVAFVAGLALTMAGIAAVNWPGRPTRP